MKKSFYQAFNEVIKKIQDNKIDPIGLEVYARAYEYDHYKKVQEDWGQSTWNKN